MGVGTEFRAEIDGSRPFLAGPKDFYARASWKFSEFPWSPEPIIVGFPIENDRFCYGLLCIFYSRGCLRGALRSLKLEPRTENVPEMDSTRRERNKNGSGSCLTRRERGEPSPPPPSISGRFPLTEAFGGRRVLLQANSTVECARKSDGVFETVMHFHDFDLD